LLSSDDTLEEAVLSLHHLLNGRGVLLEADDHINHVLLPCFGFTLKQRRSVDVLLLG
jgi:hypothetical protein